MTQLIYKIYINTNIIGPPSKKKYFLDLSPKKWVDFSVWYMCYYPHRLRDSVSHVCGIFFYIFRCFFFLCRDFFLWLWYSLDSEWNEDFLCSDDDDDVDDDDDNGDDDNDGDEDDNNDKVYNNTDHHKDNHKEHHKNNHIYSHKDGYKVTRRKKLN